MGWPRRRALLFPAAHAAVTRMPNAAPAVQRTLARLVVSRLQRVDSCPEVLQHSVQLALPFRPCAQLDLRISRREVWMHLRSRNRPLDHASLPGPL